MDNNITFGLKNCAYAAVSFENGNMSYGPVKRLSNAVELSYNVLGDRKNVLNDGILVANYYSNQGKNIQLKLKEVSTDFKIDVLGYVRNINENLVELVNYKTIYFALGFEVCGDKYKRRVWFYLCSCAPFDFDTKTIGEGSSNDVTLNIVALPITSNSGTLIKVTAKEGDPNFTFFLKNPPDLEFDNILVSFFDNTGTSIFDVNDNAILIIGSENYKSQYSALDINNFIGMVLGNE